MKTHYLILTLLLQVCTISDFSADLSESKHALAVLLSDFPSFGYLIPMESVFLILLVGTGIFMITPLRQLIDFGEFRYSLACEKAVLDMPGNESIELERPVGNGSGYSCADTTVQPEKEEHPAAPVSPHVMLVMADKTYTNYLKEPLSDYFRLTILENPNLIVSECARQKPDAVLIDENVNGVSGDELCLRFNKEEVTADIPVILLLRKYDDEKYLLYSKSGAHRLEVLAENFTRICVDVHMLIRQKARRTPAKQKMPDAGTDEAAVDKEVDKAATDFKNRVWDLLSQNMSENKYTIANLCGDMKMSRTLFFNKMKMYAKMPPSKFILEYKMGEAKKLLLSGNKLVTEVSDELGFCDLKHFEKVFKKYYNTCPTKYIEKHTGDNADVP